MLARWRAFCRLESERIDDEIANAKAGGSKKPGIARPLSELVGKFQKREKR